MIAVAKVKEAERLLSEGKLSQRTIARHVGISRASVGAIANGTRPDYEERRRQRASESEPLLGPLERCPGCGGMVYTPCRLCRVRRLKATEQAQARARRRRAQEIVLMQLAGIPQSAEHNGTGLKPNRGLVRPKKAS
jgi:hypothetical protein